jgi:NAD kinase
VVVVHRRTEYRELLDRHATRGQAEFFLRTRGQDLAALDERHLALEAARQAAASAVPADWRRAGVERRELARFAFAPDDIVVAVGQDGLVANAARHLDGQPVIGIDPEPGRNAGVLVRHRPDDCARLLAAVTAGRARLESRTTVEARLDDGQSPSALNELYVSDPGHQSARHTLSTPDGGPSGSPRRGPRGDRHGRVGVGALGVGRGRERAGAAPTGGRRRS